MNFASQLKKGTTASLNNCGIAHAIKKDVGMNKIIKNIE
tara:strand:- start:176 stop:292 length:117 start_codon:yes stop_codon:yes gene_type:complete